MYLNATSPLLAQPRQLTNYLSASLMDPGATPSQIAVGQILLEAWTHPDALRHIRLYLKNIQLPENPNFGSNVADELERQAFLLWENPKRFKQFNRTVAALYQAAAFHPGSGYAPERLQASLDTLFSGSKRTINHLSVRRVQANINGPGQSNGNPRAISLQPSEEGFINNDDGVKLWGHAAAAYAQARQLFERYDRRHGGSLNLSDTYDQIMFHTYAEALSSVKAVEKFAQDHRIDVEDILPKDSNAHLPMTLHWVDAKLNVKGKAVVLHTHRVFFHPSPNPESEIQEGIRRVGAFIDETLRYYAPKGKAERELGSFHEVYLAFDVQGYKTPEARERVKEYIRQHWNRKALQQKRFHLSFSDDSQATQLPRNHEQLASEISALSQRYKDKSLGQIIDGILYSRYVGLLLELRTVEYFESGKYKDTGRFPGKQYSIVSSGVDLLDSHDIYITENDLVLQDRKSGEVVLVEAKSSRVPLPLETALRTKVRYKLERYHQRREDIHAALARQTQGKIRKFDRVIFVIDPGRDTRLPNALGKLEKALERQYKIPVSFIFIADAGRARGPCKPHRFACE